MYTPLTQIPPHYRGTSFSNSLGIRVSYQNKIGKINENTSYTGNANTNNNNNGSLHHFNMRVTEGLHRYRDLKRNWSKKPNVSEEQTTINQSSTISTKHQRFQLPSIEHRKKRCLFQESKKSTETKSFLQNDTSSHKLSTAAEYLTTTNERKNSKKSSRTTVLNSYLHAKQSYEQPEQTKNQNIIRKPYCLNDYINEDRDEIDLDPLHVRIQQDLMKLRKLIKARQRRAEREREKNLQAKLKLLNATKFANQKSNKHLNIEQILRKLQEEYDAVPQTETNEETGGNVQNVGDFDCQSKSKATTTTSSDIAATNETADFTKMKHFLSQQLSNEERQQQPKQARHTTSSSESHILPSTESGIGSSISSQCSQYNNNNKTILSTVHQKEHQTLSGIKVGDLITHKNKNKQSTIKQAKSQQTRSIFNIQNSRLNSQDNVQTLPSTQQRRAYICSVTPEEDEDQSENSDVDEENENNIDEFYRLNRYTLHRISEKRHEKPTSTVIQYSPHDINRIHREKDLQNYHHQQEQQQQNSIDEIHPKLQRLKVKLKLPQPLLQSKRIEKQKPGYKTLPTSSKNDNEFDYNDGDDDDDYSTVDGCLVRYTYAGSSSKNQVKNTLIDNKTSTLLHILFTPGTCIQEDVKDGVECLVNYKQLIENLPRPLIDIDNDDKHLFDRLQRIRDTMPDTNVYDSYKRYSNHS